jgi:hypothetical protein
MVTVRAGHFTAPMVAVSGTAAPGDGDVVMLRLGVGVGLGVVRVAVGRGVLGVAVGVRRGPFRDGVGVGVGVVRITVGAPLRAGDRVPDGDRGVVAVVWAPLEARDEVFEGPNSEITTHAPRPKKTAAMRIRATSCIAPPPGHVRTRSVEIILYLGPYCADYPTDRLA